MPIVIRWNYVNMIGRHSTFSYHCGMCIPTNSGVICSGFIIPESIWTKMPHSGVSITTHMKTLHSTLFRVTTTSTYVDVVIICIIIVKSICGTNSPHTVIGNKISANNRGSVPIVKIVTTACTGYDISSSDSGPKSI